MITAERERLADADASAPWRRWGPYVSERAWGTIREDYSEDGAAWVYFPHEQARSRAFRWNEDGMAGFCDDRQTWCLALALWNGRDPILKERMFGLGGPGTYDCSFSSRDERKVGKLCWHYLPPRQGPCSPKEMPGCLVMVPGTRKGIPVPQTGFQYICPWISSIYS